MNITAKISDYNLKILQNSGNFPVCLRIYILIYQSCMKNGVFDNQSFNEIPRKLFKDISNDYGYYRDYLVKNKVIEYRVGSKNMGFGDQPTKFYSNKYHVCMSYRIICNSNMNYYVSYERKNKESYYSLEYVKINNSLKLIGKEGVRVHRDKFGRRLYWEGINDYKITFKDAGYSVIDAVGCHIHLLYNFCKELNVSVDEKFKDIIESGKNFYGVVSSLLRISIKDCKKRVMLWLNSKFSDFGFKKLFPVISKFIENCKKGNYKNLCKRLQWMESKLFIDNFIKNCPVEFCLPVHDGLIVKNEDVDEVLCFLKSVSSLNFSVKKL